jgi:RNA recognition motif-containing protein
MGKTVYVGNLSFAVTEQDLMADFGKYGTVISAKIITNRDTGRSKGFGFVEMNTDDEAAAAIVGLYGTYLAGRPRSDTQRRNR